MDTILTLISNVSKFKDPVKNHLDILKDNLILYQMI